MEIIFFMTRNPIILFNTRHVTQGSVLRQCTFCMNLLLFVSSCQQKYKNRTINNCHRNEYKDHKLFRRHSEVKPRSINCTKQCFIVACGSLVNKVAKSAETRFLTFFVQRILLSAFSELSMDQKYLRPVRRWILAQ
jgi:hypothetical protein